LIIDHNMRNVICFVLLLLLAGRVYCQVVAIQMDRENIAYLGIDNPITVAVENCSTGSISLTTNNGEIIGERGHFVLRPGHIGVTDIKVGRKTSKGLKPMGSMLVRVKRFPFPVVKLNGQKGGPISKDVISVQIAPAAIFEDFEFDAKLTIDGFSIIVIRGTKIVFYQPLRNPNGARFDEETRNFFKTLQVNDKVWITDITCKAPDGISRRLQSIDFIIAPDIEIQSGQKSVTDTIKLKK
jgi:gliding motility-associated GldM-like protein